MEFESQQAPGLFAASAAAAAAPNDIFDDTFAIENPLFFSDENDFKWDNAFTSYSQGTSQSYLTRSPPDVYPTPPQSGIAETYHDLPFDLYSDYNNTISDTKTRLQQATHHLSLKTVEGEAPSTTSTLNYGQFSPAETHASLNTLEMSDEIDQPSACPGSLGAKQEHAIDAIGTTPQEATPAKPVKRRRRRKKPPPSPEEEERRRERLLERNRVAAARCRKKRKSVSNELEERARTLRAENSALNQVADALKEEMLFLKTDMLNHADCGCTRVRAYLDRQASSLTLPHPHSQCRASPD